MVRTAMYSRVDPPVSGVLPVVGCRVFVVDDAGLLLMTRDEHGRHRLPGGVVEAGEGLHAAAERIAAARTGVEVEILGLVGIYGAAETVAELPGGGTAPEVVVCLRGRPVGGRLSPTAAWVEPEITPGLDIAGISRMCVEHGIAERAEPFVS